MHHQTHGVASDQKNLLIKLLMSPVLCPELNIEVLSNSYLL